MVGSGDDNSSAEVTKKWVYIGYVRSHTHDIRALTVAVPIIREGLCMFCVLCFHMHMHFLSHTYST